MFEIAGKLIFEVGDRVYYVSGRHGKGDSNPLRGTMYECKGIVDYSTTGDCTVQWDNGCHNSYTHNDLEPVYTDKSNPNFLFKHRRTKG